MLKYILHPGEPLKLMFDTQQFGFKHRTCCLLCHNVKCPPKLEQCSGGASEAPPLVVIIGHVLLTKHETPEMLLGFNFNFKSQLPVVFLDAKDILKYHQTIISLNNYLTSLFGVVEVKLK